MENIDYAEAMNYVRRKIEEKKIGVLSTSDGNRVTSRSMSFICLGSDLYFQTDRRFEKIRQLEINKKAAVCMENIQIEAEAEIKGGTELPENRSFLKKFAAEHPGSYSMYSHGRNQIVVRLIIKNITVWKYKENVVFREFLRPAERWAAREVYDMNSDEDLFHFNE